MPIPKMCYKNRTTFSFMLYGLFFVLYGTHCDSNEGSFNKVAKSKFIHGHSLQNALITRKSDLSLLCCIYACHLLPTSFSLNYKPFARICELNYEANADTNRGVILKKIPGSIHVKSDDWMKDIRCENENTIGSLIDCGIPANQSYAEFDVSHGTGLHSKARYTCHAGYHPVGKNVMECRADGTWGYRDFQCIADPPRLLIEQHVYSVEYGNDVNLTCRIVTAEPILTLHWEHARIKGPPTIMDQSLWQNDSFTTQLKITSATAQNNGTYRVMAANAGGTSYSDVQTVHVIGGTPAVSILVSSPLHVVSGNNITIQCSLSAIPAATTMEWMRDTSSVSTQEVLSSCRHYTGSITDPVLTIKYVNFDDEGMYYCKATNPIGTDESNKLYLNVTHVHHLLNESCESCPSSFYCATKEAYNVCLRYLSYEDDVERSKEDFEETCICFGANLIQIDSAIKQNIVEEFLLSEEFPQRRIWIQGSYDNGLWRFDDGTRMSYTNWDATEGHDPEQSYVVMGKEMNYRWRDAHRKSRRNWGALCEIRLS